MPRNRRRRRRRWRKGRCAALLAIVVLIVAGVIFFVKGGSTKYTSVNKGLGESLVKANESAIASSTGKDLKKALYVPRKLDTTKPLIAFTFDDGPKKGNTTRVVKALEKYDYRATFFMLGLSAATYPDEVKTVLKSGNEIAGHSWNHPQLTKIGVSGVTSQMSRMNNAISKVTNSNVGLVRPPYGAYNDSVRATVDAPLILWSVDTLDWKTRNVDATVNNIMKNAKDGDIVLMHDIHIQTVEAVEKVLPKLKAKGYEVCTVSELMEAKGIKMQKGDVVISAHQIIKKK